MTSVKCQNDRRASRRRSDASFGGTRVAMPAQMSCAPCRRVPDFTRKARLDQPIQACDAGLTVAG